MPIRALRSGEAIQFAESRFGGIEGHSLKFRVDGVFSHFYDQALVVFLLDGSE